MGAVVVGAVGSVVDEEGFEGLVSDVDDPSVPPWEVLGRVVALLPLVLLVGSVGFVVLSEGAVLPVGGVEGCSI